MARGAPVSLAHKVCVSIDPGHLSGAGLVGIHESGSQGGQIHKSRSSGRS